VPVAPVLELALLVAIPHIVTLAAYFQMLPCIGSVSAVRAARHIRSCRHGQKILHDPRCTGAAATMSALARSLTLDRFSDPIFLLSQKKIENARTRSWMWSWKYDPSKRY